MTDEQAVTDPNALPVGTVIEVCHTDGTWALMFHQPDGRWSCALGPGARTHRLAPDETWRWPSTRPAEVTPDPCDVEHPDAGCADVGCRHNCEEHQLRTRPGSGGGDE